MDKLWWMQDTAQAAIQVRMMMLHAVTSNTYEMSLNLPLKSNQFCTTLLLDVSIFVICREKCTKRCVQSNPLSAAAKRYGKWPLLNGY